MAAALQARRAAFAMGRDAEARLRAFDGHGKASSLARYIDGEPFGTTST